MASSRSFAVRDLLVFVCWIVLGGKNAQADIDVSLLHLLRDSQEANSHRYSMGRMALTYNDEDVANAEHLVMAGVFAWDGGQTFINYSRKVLVLGTETIKEQQIDVRLVETPERRLTYQPRWEVMTILPPLERKRLAEEFQLLPKERWFRPGTGGFRTFRELLEPSFCPENEISYSVERIDGKLAEAKRVYKIGGVMRCVYDLSEGMNLISYEIDPRNTKKNDGVYSLSERGTFKWVPDIDGHYRLGEMTIETMDGNVWKRRLRLSVTEFDPHPSFMRSQFSEAALEMKSGTVIKDTVKSNHPHYKLGRVSQKLSDSELENLSKSLKSEGFANPSRGKAQR